jgi:hypothetical protein
MFRGDVLHPHKGLASAVCYLRSLACFVMTDVILADYDSIAIRSEFKLNLR